MRDLQPKLLARRLIERRRDPDRGLALFGLIEDALPGEIGRHAFNQDLAARLNRLLGDIHVEDATLDVYLAEYVGGDRLVEARRTAKLDVLELEILPKRHVEGEAALGGAAEIFRRDAYRAHIAKGLMVEQLEHRRGRSVGLESDLAALGGLAQVGNEEAAVVQGNLLAGGKPDLALRNIDHEGRPGDLELGAAGEDWRHLLEIGEAHASKIEVHVDRLRREFLPRFCPRKLAGC